MGGHDDDCDWSHVTLNVAWRRKEWALALGGATLFVIVSKETVFMTRLHWPCCLNSKNFAKKWYRNRNYYWKGLKLNSNKIVWTRPHPFPSTAHFICSFMTIQSEKYTSGERCEQMFGLQAISKPQKVSLLINLLHNKSWYNDLMTFLVALAMGTMYCVTVIQFIPEALGKSTH